MVNSDEAWSIGFALSKNPLESINLQRADIVSFKEIDSLGAGNTRFIADPFLIVKNDVFYIFFEHQGEGDADIGLLISVDGEQFNYEGIVLNEPFHLSFPQVFQNNGEYYMVPESKQANNVLLYQANNFPFGWKVIDTLIRDRKLEDPALLLSDSLNIISASEIGSLTQYLFTSDSLRGDWNEHPAYEKRRGNETRAGGGFFQTNGEWYLPLQNNSSGYGTGVSLYKLLQRGKKLHFEEVSDMHLGPTSFIPWFGTGMHHLDIEHLGNNYYSVFDGKKKMSEEKVYSYRASIKYNLFDLYNFLFGN